MTTFYLILKLIHISAAITAVGSNITYGVWNARIASEPAHTSFALKGIKFLDHRIANPSYGVLFLTGLIMIFSCHCGLALWLIVALLLVIVVSTVVFAPLR